MLLIMLVGRLGRYYFGKKLIQGVDAVLRRVPLLNRIYAALKQIHEAHFPQGHLFKQVVLVEFAARPLFTRFYHGAKTPSTGETQRLGFFVPTRP
jgi:uncharacterized membrane protein